MALHKIDSAEQTPRCEVCGELAGWIDKDVHNIQTTKEGQMENIGTGKGLVYATCDAPNCPLKNGVGKGIVCNSLHNRPVEHQHTTLATRQIKPRRELNEPYKNTEFCMLEGFYVNHDGKLTTFQVCRNQACIQHFQEEGKKMGQLPIGAGG